MAESIPELAEQDGPLFRRIATYLRREIAEGRMPVGTALPTEAKLRAQFGVSRSTIRAALAELKQRGVVAARRGIGTIVTAESGTASYREVYGNVAELFAFANQRPIQSARAKMITADARLAGLMHTQPGRRFLRINGVRRVPGREGPPVAAVEIFVDERYAEVEKDIPTLSCSIAEQIERRFGVRISHIDQEIEVTTIPSETAVLLDCEPGAAALRLSRLYYAAGEAPIEYARSLYPADRFAYRTRIYRSSTNP